MNSCNQQQKLFSEKLATYFEANPGRFCDVAFAVGPQKEIIKASRLILEVACPQFMKLFEETWGQSIVKDGDENCIPLVDVSPSAFKLFLKLLITDNISVDELKLMTVNNVEDLLNVMELCKKYEMSLIQQNSEEVAQERVYDQFASFVESDTFVKLSQGNLSTILSSNNLGVGAPETETEVLDAALKWAEFQCSDKGIIKSGENMRLVLGDALFSIRFPTMTTEEFANGNWISEILTKEEQLDIFRYICLNDKSKCASIQFCTEVRVESKSQTQLHLSTVNALSGFSTGTSPPFVCDGVENQNYFHVNKSILLHSVGFLGPIDSSAYYDVTVELTSGGGNPPVTFGKVVKRVFAKKSKIFHVFFDEPIVVNILNTWYRVRFCLKGPNTPCSLLGTNSCKNFSVGVDGVDFFLEWYPNAGAELCFTKC